jgi:intracellular sulfur oxidation DsrE/DsrF family protein
MGAMSVTVTVVVAAAGIYFFDKSHTKAQVIN